MVFYEHMFESKLNKNQTRERNKTKKLTHNEWDLLSKRKHKNGFKIHTETESAQFYDEFNVEKISIY